MKRHPDTCCLPSAMDWIQKAVHQNAKEHGFWEQSNLGEKVALIHSELSEALEALRDGISAPSEKIDGFTHLEEEMADAVIRIMDLAQHLNLRLGAAIIAKHGYNLSRPYKHGRNF